MGINRAYLDDLIGGYFEMGSAALERREFAIALKMFRAVFEEPGSRQQREKIMLELLLKTAQAHEGLKQLYKAKLLYIRALALLKRSGTQPGMQSVEILMTLAILTANQGLYRQALDFALEANSLYRKLPAQVAIDFIRRLRLLERIMAVKDRKAEQAILVQILQELRSEAITNLNLSDLICPLPQVAAV